MDGARSHLAGVNFFDCVGSAQGLRRLMLMLMLMLTIVFFYNPRMPAYCSLRVVITHDLCSSGSKYYENGTLARLLL